MNYRPSRILSPYRFSVTLVLAILVAVGVAQAHPLLVRSVSLGDPASPQAGTPTPPPVNDELSPAAAEILAGSSLEKPQLSAGMVVKQPVYSQPTGMAMRALSLSAAPSINLWYGETQSFGQLGTAQRWLNVLGDVQNAAEIASLVYSLNGGLPAALSIGPDDQRLASPGDFNIELDTRLLLAGANQIVITATNTTDDLAVAHVQVNYQPQAVWPLPYSIDWSGVTGLQSVAQVVDGRWAVEGGALRPLLFDYDRLMAIGDQTWTDYEVTVPVIVHSMDESGFAAPSNGPGIGILTRWTGHFQVGDEQPRTGWQNLGALGWFRWKKVNNVPVVGMMLTGFGNSKLGERSDIGLDFGVNYIFKMRVQSNPGQGATYSFKAWAAAESEPVDWQLVGQGNVNEPPTGSVVLVAHHVDASFGNVSVTPLNANRPLLTVNTIDAGSVALIPTLPDYPYGQYVRLAATGSQGHMLGSWSGGLSGNANPGALTLVANTSVTATFVPSVALISDDFNRCLLGATPWNFINPLGDSTLTLNGAQAYLSVPAGANHDVWTGTYAAPRLMQPAPSGDFELEVKFESSVSSEGQAQGILIEQDANNVLRFDVHRETSTTRVFAGKIINGTGTQLRNTTFSVDHPRYMRVRRVGDQWTQLVSRDGIYWTFHHSFSQPLTVSKVGVFAANKGGAAAPSHVGIIDYFFTNADPITPEDGSGLRPVVNVVGNGTVTLNPNKVSYACGEAVTLTAASAAGWSFAGWSGSSTGNTNPTQLLISGGQNVTATFNLNSYLLNITPNGSGSVTADPAKASYTPGESVTLAANAETGWVFMGWSGDLTGNANPATLVMDSNKSVVANFSVATATATATATNTDVPGPGGTPTFTPTPSAMPTDTSTNTPTATNTDLPLPGDTATPTSTLPATSTATPTNTGEAGPIDTPTATSTNTAIPTPSDTATPVATPTAGSPPPGAVASDDFNRCTLDGTGWQWVNPRDDGATYALDGEHLVIDVPNGAGHDLWKSGLNAPRLMQSVTDTDFEVEVKFDSPVNQRFQLEGLLIQQDEETLLRVNFQDEGPKAANDPARKLVVFVGLRTGASVWTEAARLEVPALPPPYFLQVIRHADQWTMRYGFDGSTWQDVVTLSQPMLVRQVGVFAGNAGYKAEAIPAHRAVVDYFLNRALPLDPEDGKALALPVHIAGEGIVTVSPPCGNPATLSASPQLGWLFTGWSGALIGKRNPTTLQFAKSDVVTATFALATGYTVTFTTTSGGGQIFADPPGPTYDHGQIVTLTAVPDDGWRFVRWEVSADLPTAAEGLDTPTIQLTIPDTRHYLALFAPVTETHRLLLPVVLDP